MKTLVIGGGTGIGAEVAELIALELGDSLYTPSPTGLDVRDSFHFDDYFRDVGPFDRIVYSAGINGLMPIGEIDMGWLDLIYDVNVKGFIKLLDAVVRMRAELAKDRRESCSIVAVVSDSATTAMRHSIAYASSKAALAHAVRCGARELAPWCRVNGVSPSIVDDTPMTASVDRQVLEHRSWSAEEARRYEMSLVPMGRRATKLEVAKLVVDVLAGPEFLTGAIIPITGGK